MINHTRTTTCRRHPLSIALAGIFLCASLASLATAPAHAGLFDKILAGDKNARYELKEASDRTEVFAKAFSQGGAFGKSATRAEFEARKVAIAGFQIEFAIEQVATASGSVEKVYTLKEVNEERLQKIVDGAYDVFVDLLRKRGHEVLPRDAIKTPGFQAELAKANNPPVKWERNGLSKMFGGGNRTELDKDNVSITATAKDTAPDLWETRFSLPPGMKLADELGVPVITLRLKFNFARFDDSGTWGWAPIDDKPQNMLAATGTKFDVYLPMNKWTPMPMYRSVLLPNSVAEKAEELAYTGGQVAATTATVGINVLTGFLRGGLSGAAGGAGKSIRSVAGSGGYTVTADEKYDANTAKDIALALEMVIEGLPKGVAKELPKDAVKEPAKDAVKEVAKDVSAEVPKEATKEPATEPAKEPAAEPAKEPAKEPPAEQPK